MHRILFAVLAILGSTTVLVGAASPPLVSESQATASAVNRLTPTPEGWHLDHPSYAVRFDERGIQLEHDSGPDWSFRLAEVSVGGQTLSRVEPTPPQAKEGLVIAYERGGVVEEYVAQDGALEQRFHVAPFEGELSGTLVIEGRIDSLGTFAAAADGWTSHHRQPIHLRIH